MVEPNEKASKKNLKKIKRKKKYEADNHWQKLFRIIASSVAKVYVKKKVEFCFEEELADCPEGQKNGCAGFVVYSKKEGDLVTTLTVTIAHLFEDLFGVLVLSNIDEIMERFDFEIKFFNYNYPYTAVAIVFSANADVIIFITHSSGSPRAQLL